MLLQLILFRNWLNNNNEFHQEKNRNINIFSKFIAQIKK